MAEKHYLENELYQKIQTDPSIFSWLESGSLDGLWYWDIQNPHEEWLSPRFKEIFGYSDDEIPNTSEWWQANIFPEDLKVAIDNFEKHCQDPEHPYDQIVRYRHKQGHTVWVRCRGIAIRDEQGQATRLLGAHTDVTALMEANEKLRLALKASRTGIWTWQIGSERIHWSDEMFELYQIPKEGFTNHYSEWTKRVHPDDLDAIEVALQKTINEDAPFDTSYRIFWPDGSIRYIRAQAESVANGPGDRKVLMGANWDITQTKQQELELERSNNELSSFAYVASHDLKSPLRAIKQLAQWVQEDLGEVPPEVEKNIELMNNRIGRMESLLDDLLAYSRVGKESAKREMIDTRKLVSDVIALLNVPEHIEITVQDDMPHVQAAKAPLALVFRNLIGNAIKHNASAKGFVRISAAEDAKRYRFCVEDNGPGIPRQYHSKIFELFQTLRPRDAVEGSGMGLATVRKVIDNHHGTIHVESDAPEFDPKASFGSRFIFTWPK